MPHVRRTPPLLAQQLMTASAVGDAMEPFLAGVHPASTPTIASKHSCPRCPTATPTSSSPTAASSAARTARAGPCATCPRSAPTAEARGDGMLCSRCWETKPAAAFQASAPSKARGGLTIQHCHDCKAALSRKRAAPPPDVNPCASCGHPTPPGHLSGGSSQLGASGGGCQECEAALSRQPKRRHVTPPAEAAPAEGNLLTPALRGAAQPGWPPTPVPGGSAPLCIGGAPLLPPATPQGGAARLPTSALASLKACGRCGEAKPRGAFCESAASRDGGCSNCRDCSAHDEAARSAAASGRAPAAAGAAPPALAAHPGTPAATALRPTPPAAAVLKTCAKCKAEKPRSAFYKSDTSRDGVAAQCKACVVAHLRSYIAASRAVGTDSTPAAATASGGPGRSTQCAAATTGSLKRCSQCKEARPRSAFTGSDTSGDSLCHRCCRCSAARRRRCDNVGPATSGPEAATATATAAELSEPRRAPRRQRKCCARCQGAKPLSAFSPYVTSRDGLHSLCRACEVSAGPTNADGRRAAGTAASTTRTPPQVQQELDGDAEDRASVACGSAPAQSGPAGSPDAAPPPEAAPAAGNLLIPVLRGAAEPGSPPAPVPEGSAPLCIGDDPLLPPATPQGGAARLPTSAPASPKACGMCGEAKPRGAFCESAASRGGGYPTCRDCCAHDQAARSAAAAASPAPPVAAMSKTCARCKAEKPRSAFHRNGNSRDGLAAYCRECMVAYARSRTAARRAAGCGAPAARATAAGTPGSSPGQEVLATRSAEAAEGGSPASHGASGSATSPEAAAARLTASAPANMTTCPECLAAKPRSAFYQNATFGDGRDSSCRACFGVSFRTCIAAWWAAASAAPAAAATAAGIPRPSPHEALPVAAMTKTCTKCKTEKPRSAFFKNASIRDGLHYCCRECSRAYQRSYLASRQAGGSRAHAAAPTAPERCGPGRAPDHQLTSRARCQEAKPPGAFSPDAASQDSCQPHCGACEAATGAKGPQGRHQAAGRAASSPDPHAAHPIRPRCEVKQEPDTQAGERAPLPRSGGASVLVPKNTAGGPDANRPAEDATPSAPVVKTERRVPEEEAAGSAVAAVRWVLTDGHSAATQRRMLRMLGLRPCAALLREEGSLPPGSRELVLERYEGLVRGAMMG
eukprot:jgi/Tetstr1/427280/TSEL_001733.t1